MNGGVRLGIRLLRAIEIARPLAVAAALSLAAGCATLPEDPADRAEVIALNDPIEPANRMMFAINEAVDVFAIRPAAVVYRDFMPDPGKELIYNFVRHISLPLTIVNDVMQGEWDRADIAAKRFFVNSIAGFGGVVDAATGLGLPHHKEDFGQTLATYDVAAGPYLVLPLVGPSSARHAVGRIFDFVLDPFTYLLAAGPPISTIATRGMSIVDERYRLLGPLDEVKKSSLDYYATMRSLYRQRRALQIENRDEGRTPTLGAVLAPASPTAPFALYELSPFDAIAETPAPTTTAKGG